jgi:hypothetical protein
MDPASAIVRGAAFDVVEERTLGKRNRGLLAMDVVELLSLLAELLLFNEFLLVLA